MTENNVCMEKIRNYQKMLNDNREQLYFATAKYIYGSINTIVIKIGCLYYDCCTGTGVETFPIFNVEKFHKIEKAGEIFYFSNSVDGIYLCIDPIKVGDYLDELAKYENEKKRE